MVDLDAMAKTKSYFQRSGWHSAVVAKYVLRAIAVLGGNLSVNWDSLTEE
jgi:hypothetical protein